MLYDGSLILFIEFARTRVLRTSMMKDIALLGLFHGTERFLVFCVAVFFFSNRFSMMMFLGRVTGKCKYKSFKRSSVCLVELF